MAHYVLTTSRTIEAETLLDAVSKAIDITVTEGLNLGTIIPVSPHSLYYDNKFQAFVDAGLTDAAHTSAIPENYVVTVDPNLPGYMLTNGIEGIDLGEERENAIQALEEIMDTWESN